MEFDFDVIVIGSGAGGGTLAAACAASGKNVLLIERGHSLSASSSHVANSAVTHDEQSVLIDKTPYDDREVILNGRGNRLYISGVTGGGTELYGGALLRPRPEDFEPGRYYRDRLPKAIHCWPVGFEELAGYFDVAEGLYRVVNPDLVHIQPSNVTPSMNSCRSGLSLLRKSEPKVSDESKNRDTGLPLAAVNVRLMGCARNAGLMPYRLPLAIDARTCLRCDHCAGFPCPTGSRRSSSQLIADSIARGESLTLMTGSEVVRLIRNRNRRGDPRSLLDGVEILDRASQRRQTLRARRYVLAAGAVGSPVILLRSGYEHPLIGRNYMTHYSPLSVGIYLRRTEADSAFIKQVGLSDFYFGTADLPEKMGVVQSLPAPGPLMMRKAGLKRVPSRLLQTLRARMLPLMGIVEDLPSPGNRVTIADNGRIGLRHSFSEYDSIRGRALEREMTRLLRLSGAIHCVGSQIPSREHVAHQCGTLRFGTHRESAVADRSCRLFDQEDVFVADGSFMPTSLGVGPSLTIVSNALRVADTVISEC